MIEKNKLIDSYIKTRPPENGTFSETYRWWINEKFYIPLYIDEIKKKWKMYLLNNKNPLINFYIHIPFCYKKCTYCFYYKEIFNKDKLDSYLEYLLSYLSEFVEVFKDTKFKSLYIWWGTPTILSEEQISKLLGFINNNFNFLNWAEMTFEWNPLSFTKEKIEIISKMWINRVSMWVQSLDENVLKISNREYQNISMIKKSIKNMQFNWIKNINIDLIMWLKEDTVEKFWFTLDEIIKMNPYSITIYWLWPTDSYVKMYYWWNINYFFNDLNSKIDDYYKYIISNSKYISSNIELNIDKWNVHIWTIHLKDNNNNNKIRYSYNDSWEWSLFGVWPSSRSHIYWELVYKTIKDLNYTIINNKNIINIGESISIYDEISLYVIVEIRDRLYIDHNLFFKKFLINFSDFFKNELAYFESKNIIKNIDGKTFFNMDINKKLYYSLFFINKEKLIKKNLFNTKNIKNIIFNYEISWFNIIIYYDKEIKYEISNNYNLNVNNIVFLDNILSKIKKIISILNRDNVNILNSIKVFKKVFNDINSNQI